jgi:hypothetical protein
MWKEVSEMAESDGALSLAGPVSLQLYKDFLAALGSVGTFREEVKKTSIHLMRESAFAGVHPRKQYLLLTIKAAEPIRNPRISKTEQVSNNRWHLEVKLTATNEIDPELLGWIRKAYELCA